MTSFVALFKSRGTAESIERSGGDLTDPQAVRAVPGVVDYDDSLPTGGHLDYPRRIETKKRLPTAAVDAPPDHGLLDVAGAIGEAVVDDHHRTAA